MTPEAFRALVRRHEAEAARDPKGYERRVGAFALLGYAYLAFVLAVVAALIAGTVALAFVARGSGAILAKLLLPLGLLAWAIVRAFWVRLPSPDGLELLPADAPALFALLARVRARLRAPRIHHVLLIPQFNAAIVQVPRLGVFGWQRNYLLLGASLLHALTPEQLETVVAHEAGHLSGNHSRFAGWIYRVRQTWNRLAERVRPNEAWLTRQLLGRFLEWYAPTFGAYSFALARADEYVADACAAEVAGREAAAGALLRLVIAGRALDEGFWPSVDRRAGETTEPPADIYRELADWIASAPGPEQARQWLAEAWRVPTDYDDTHPALRDRLAALGHGPEAPVAAPPPMDVGASAAAQLLGEGGRAKVSALAAAWREGIAERWAAAHAERAEARARLAELEAGAAAGTLSPEQAWERVQLVADLASEQEALPLAEAVLAGDAEHVGARWFVGRTLLGRGDDAGIAHLETAMRLAPDAELPGAQAIFGYLWRQGRTEEAERWRRRAETRSDELDAAHAERHRVDKHVPLEPHGLPDEVVAALRAQVATVEDALEVYLARRTVTHLPERPCWLVGVVARRKWYGPNPKREVAVRDAVLNAAAWPDTTFAVLVMDELKPLRKRFRAIPGATLLERR